jgi:glutamate synthase domain-containing protein 3
MLSFRLHLAHHDISSIEDLAQFIHDLHAVKEKVCVSGKLISLIGKSMHGEEIVIVPDSSAGFVAADSSIVGNACVYGATNDGRTSERFCVRNSGAFAVAEGVGDHCCEYMTGDRWDWLLS